MKMVTQILHITSKKNSQPLQNQKKKKRLQLCPCKKLIKNFQKFQASKALSKINLTNNLKNKANKFKNKQANNKTLTNQY